MSIADLYKPGDFLVAESRFMRVSQKYEAGYTHRFVLAIGLSEPLIGCPPLLAKAKEGGHPIS